MTITEISKITGVSRQTLYNWKKNKPDLFRIIEIGCAKNS